MTARVPWFYGAPISKRRRRGRVTEKYIIYFSFIVTNEWTWFNEKKKYINDVVDGAAWFETRVCLYYIMYLCVVNRACYRSIKSIIYESRLCGGGGASWNKKKNYIPLWYWWGFLGGWKKLEKNEIKYNNNQSETVVGV